MLIVIIVSWNVRDLLRACLCSLDAYSATSHAQQVIVVDNASSDGSIEMVRREFPGVFLVANTTNRGFTGGNNDGIKAAEGFFTGKRSEASYIFLLNPDAEVTPGALDTLLAYADRNPDAGMIGSQLVFPDGSTQSSRRRFPTLLTAIFESTWLQPYAPHRVLDSFYMRDMPDTDVCDVDWLYGAAMLVRRSTYAQCGILDEETFFMYSEEVDWCRRIKASPLVTTADSPLATTSRTWRIVFVPQARIVHHEGQSSAQVSAQRMVYFNTSKVRYFRKHHGALQAQILRAVLLSMFAYETLLEGAKWLVGHRRALRGQRVQSYMTVLRSRLQ
jgi:N-acetylglucosaminyl-diphospho-decaprenol L-rhamnosyltransferase